MRLLIGATRARIRRGVGFVRHVERTQHVNQKAARYCLFRDYSQECLPEPQEFPGRAALAGAAAGGMGLSERPSAPAVTEGNPKIDGIQKSKFSTSEAI